MSKELISQEHPDIDILLENPIHVPYMLNQINLVRSKQLPAVVIIDNKEIKFDYRYVGDAYYDEKWSKDILKNRILNSDGIFIPSNKDYFYSLIYHCVIHGASTRKYYDQLQALSDKINIKYNEEINSNTEKLSKLLSEFMKKRNYTHTSSLKYKINHNEFNRLYKVGMFVLKYEGISGLIRAGKGKIKRKLKK